MKQRTLVNPEMLDFCFLAVDAILVLLATGVLEVYSFNERGFTCIARYALPNVRPEFVCSAEGGGTISCNTPYLPTPPWNASWFESHPLPFYPNSQERTCAITFGHIFFIDMRIFFSSSGVYSTQPNAFGASIRPWASWGPQNSRCFLSDWRFGVFGSKTVSVYRVGYSPASFRLRLREFNPYLLQQNNSGARSRGWVVTTPSTISAGNAFTEDVTTYLPYREVIGEVEHRVNLDELSEILVDDLRVVIIRVSYYESLHAMHS
ncbi:hypothetical protein SERLA73DRAFT_72385 [Serpula lacrymans var. lacrymans S7.3]|uniref:Uncharacterized protein n=2 Tax=Serpula lacrymans var. lacrymans TaxID=341189 RepID=F8PVX8_SERL3|nr:uncharacterized protein SERLADRAFT_436905 [Serpula lacrymans var. lacrymans S7.9]EGN99574.1 hypothetical protein SERLA73DRAFT_72385 [Serpula lacrymans var. lacrymans S7.3]EGO25143.1 hypothetical protein SERLADRAFT_436905 [Serpula lacrymans var. lacrymans S7.9]